MSLPILFWWFSFLGFSHLLAVVMFWKRRSLFGLSAKALMILWGTILLWYSFAASSYFFLTINCDALQMKWAALLWFLELPLLGGGLNVSICYLLSRPIRNYVASKGAIDDPAKLYEKVLRYPLNAGVFLFLLAVGSYGFGALQLRLFPRLPYFELAKIMVNGVTVSVFACIIYYLAFDRLLGPVRVRIEKEFNIKDVAKTRISRKMFTISSLITCSSLAIVCLFALQAFQIMIKEDVAASMRRDAQRLSAEVLTAKNPSQIKGIVGGIRYGRRGKVFRLGPGERLPDELFSAYTLELVASRPSGIVDDLKDDLKILFFLEGPKPGQKLVSVAFLRDFYSPLNVLVRFFAGACLCVAVLTVGFITIITIISTGAIRSLTSAVRKAIAGDAPYTAHVNTADEIEELSHAFSHFIGQSQDLQKRLEEKVKELSSANQERDDLLHAVSHDLRAPLINIQGFAKRLEPVMDETLRALEDVSGESEAPHLHKKAMALKARVEQKFSQSMQFIFKGVEKMDSLLSSLLAMSRVGRKAEPVLSNDLNDILNDVLATFDHKIQEQSIQVIRRELPKDVPCRRDEIDQVFSNLIANAIQYMGNGSERIIEIGGKEQDEYVECFVRDTGLGIADKDCERIFQMFTRLQVIEVPGEGVGLAYVRKIISSHGGRIWVQSREGEGSTFVFILPKRATMSG